MALFRVIVELESGEMFCPVFVSAESRSAAIDLARDHDSLKTATRRPLCRSWTIRYLSNSDRLP